MIDELYSSLTNDILLEQFDLDAIKRANDTAKKQVLWNEFVGYINSLKNVKDREKVIRFITGSTRVPLERKIQVKITLIYSCLFVCLLQLIYIF